MGVESFCTSASSTAPKYGAGVTFLRRVLLPSSPSSPTVSPGPPAVSTSICCCSFLSSSFLSSCFFFSLLPLPLLVFLFYPFLLFFWSVNFPHLPVPRSRSPTRPSSPTSHTSFPHLPLPQPACPLPAPRSKSMPMRVMGGVGALQILRNKHGRLVSVLYCCSWFTLTVYT